jgi:cytoskeletal protein RodZ
MTMKKLLSITLVLGLIFSLVGCHQNASQQSAQATTQLTTATTTTATTTTTTATTTTATAKETTLASASTTESQLNEQETITYLNEQYGFRLSLPASWQNYKIVNAQWEGIALEGTDNGQVTETGPLLSIRHPLWTAGTPRQDIPIMVFTTAQWQLVQQETLSVGAAPFPPSELCHNSGYVLALPARYNYAFPSGFEEVETIIKSNPLQAFDP